MRFFSSKHLYAALITIVIVMPFVLAGQSSINVGNAEPVFEDEEGNLTLPSDGWSSEASPAKVGNEVTFTATATDANGDDYYLAICKTDSITPRGILPPQCDGGTWAASDFPMKSGQTEILTYQIQQTDPAVNEWYAFVCDSVRKNSQCSEASQGSGDSGSPFYTPEQAITVIRFGSDCPDLAELSELSAPDPDAVDLIATGFGELQKPLSRNEIRQLIDDELEKAEGEAISSKLKLVRDRVEALKALKKEEKLTNAQKYAVADYLVNKSNKLQKLASKNVRFCLVTDVESEGIEDVVDKKGKKTQVKNSHQIDKKGLGLDFRNDEKRNIDIHLLERSFKERPILKADDSVLQAEGPRIEYKDPDDPNKLTTIEPASPSPEWEDVYNTFTLHHEIPEEEKGFGDMLMGIFGEEETGGTAFRMNVIESQIGGQIGGQIGVTEEEVIYQSADNRKIDIYKYINEPTSVIPHQIKNYTLYHYGDGEESELYTIDNAVLHMRDDGVIEGYYFEGVDLSQVDGAENADGGLLERASRVMALEYAKDLHENGGPNPDFTIPAPFVLDRDNNVLETLTYEIVGENYDQLNVSFTADIVAYPLVLDPTLLFTAPGAGSTSDVITGETTNNYFGYALATGDLDADGDTDLAVGAHYYSNWAGRTYIFYNDDGYTSSAGSADEIITGESSSYFGYALAIGDLNSDGTADLAVGAKNCSSSKGCVQIFYNDGSYPSSASNADVDIDGEAIGYFGCSLAISDLDGDGDADLVSGNSYHSSNAGRVYILYQDGSWPADAGSADVTITGEASSRFGASLVTGDLDADGNTDIVVGGYGYNSNQGRVYIFYQDATLWGTSSCTTGCVAADADVIITGNASSLFGASLATGDLDADGTTDLAVTDSTSAGHVYIFHNDGSIPTTAGTADVTITGEANSYLGQSIAIGDMNADGTADLVAGGMNYSGNKGRVYIFYNDGSIPTTAATADVIITGEATNDYLGNSLAIGDLNADGTIDLAVGAYMYSGSGATGRAYIFYGESGLEHRNTITGDSTYRFGWALTTGDLNADGTTDLAVGAPYHNTDYGRVYIFYNNGSYATGAASADVIIAGESSSYFGKALTTGDLNADGTTDLAVGGTSWNGGTGRAYIFHNDGSIPTTAFTADVKIDGESSSNYFGEGLTTGDLDADGTTDLAVGAYYYNTGQGRAYIFHNDGSIPTTAATADVKITGEANNDFGIALTTGDLDADGTTDLAVGGYGYSTNRGRAYIFYNDGSIPTTAGTADVIITGEVGSNNYFGRALTTGDLDADGTTDLAVAAYSYDGAVGNEGRAYIFHNDGSIPTTAGTADVIITGEAGSYFGIALTTGDLDADGDDDLAVGGYQYDVGTNTNEGRAYIFHNDGSIPTTAATADVIITGESSSLFGASLATGDLNADGTTDLAVGAYYYSSYRGRAYIFYGDREYAWNALYSYPQEPPNANRPSGFRYGIEGVETSEEFGKAFAVGDFDGDGINDLAVGAPAYNSNQGRVYLFLNDGDMGEDDSEADVVITGEANDMFGFSLAAGEISETQDTIDDLYIGAPTNGSTGSASTYIFNGRTSWSSTYTYADNSKSIAWSPTASNRCGYAVAIGNVGGDGRSDVIYGCNGYSTNKGIVFTSNNDGDYNISYDDYCYPSASTTEKFGSSLAIGDIDADGDDDIIGGAPGYSSDTGQVHICYNDGDYGTNTDLIITGETAGDKFGTSVAVGPLKDTRDQWDDIAVGAPGYSSGYGRVYVFYNDGSYPVAASADKIITDTAAYGLGQSLAVADVSHDGRKDLIIGRPGLFSNRGCVLVSYNDGNLNTSTSSDLYYYGDVGTTGYFGNNLAVGDINNDGWDDIITGAYGINSSKGKAYAITMDSARLYGAAINTQFSYDYTTGDFNGDGKDDLAVGAPTYSSNTGRVYIFFNNVNSLFKGAYASVADITITGGANDMFGYSLAAGTVGYDTADTIDDLVVGAPTNGSVGTAGVFVFEGSAAGTLGDGTCTSACDYTDANDELANNSAFSYRCGYSVAVGNFNANHSIANGSDVTDDIAQSCPGYSTNRGITWFNWKYDGYGDAYNDYSYCYSTVGGYANDCGASMAVGDVDGDGYEDLVVGAPGYNNIGRVFTLLNDGDYNATANDDYIDGETSGDKFGTSVSVGDLDADGDDDILVGAPEYGTSAGAAYVFYNDGSYPTAAGSADKIITHSTSTDYFGVSVLAADMTNDGRDDIIIGTDYRIYWFYNDGSYPTASSGADLALSAASGVKFYNLQIGDWNNDGKNDLIAGQSNYATDRGLAIIFMGEYLQIEPPTLTSITITDTSGYTNDSTPNITISYNSSYGIPTHVEFSCNAGTNWSDPVPYPSDNIINDDADDSVWNMTNGATGCSASNGSKTITARLYNGYGYKGYSGTTNDTTYYDTAAPTSLSLTANNTSATQISLNPFASDGSGSGLHATPYYYTEAVGASCTRTGWTGYIATDPYTWGSLNANTQYSFDFKARDALGQESGYSSCQTLYTSANTPVEDNKYTDDHSTNTTGSIYWHWDSGGSEKNYALDDTSNCSSPLSGAETLTNDYFNDSTPSASNTAYTRYVCARNEDDDLTTAFTLGPAYTLADTPGAPTLSNEAITTIDVDPVSGGSEKDMAIYVADSDPHCDGFNGYGYVQYDVGGSGGLLGTQSFATDTNWTTDFTVTGLSANTTYYFCAKARNEDAAHTNDVTPFGSTASTSTLDNPPAYTTLTISDTGGFTNSSNPSMTYSGLSGGTPTSHKYSCNNSDWSFYTSYENPTTDFDITSASYGCNGSTNETKNVYVILNNAGGDSSAQSDSTYYDDTGPTITTPSLTVNSTSQITVYAGTPSDSGSGPPWDYYYASGFCAGDGGFYGYTTSTNHAFSGLSANTQYSWQNHARDELDNVGSFSSCATAKYTHANIPVVDSVHSDDHSANTTGSIYWQWDTGGAEKNFALDDTSDCSSPLSGAETLTVDYFNDSTPTAANTQYTRYVCARNEDDDLTSSFTLGPAYTSADVPGTPTVSNATSATLDVNPVTGGTETTMAIYVEQGSTCDGADGEGYVQADGTIDTGEIWQSDGTWDTTTVTSLTASTQYAFCAKAKNGDGDETAFSATAGTGTTLATPAFTEGPSDGGSSTTTPTDEGDNVTFTAKSNNGASYWLLVCNNGSVPTVGSPPECNGGAGNRIARSAETATNVEASDTHDTTGESSESYAWYAFVCDAGSCSAASQASGDNGSPYEVNHRPSIGAVNIGDTTGGTGTIEAGEDVFFNVVVTDTDTSGGADTIDMHVCQTNSFTPGSGCDSNQTICATTGNASGVNAECDSGDLSGDLSGTYNDIGTSADQKTVYIFLEDNHDFEDADTNTQNYTVSNTAPAFTIEPTDGDPWTSQTVSEYWQDIDFADEDYGWIVAGPGVIYSTSNGGVNWGSQTSGVTESLANVSFVSTTTGWVVGADDGVGGDAVILKTINGSSWSGQTSGTTNNLTDVHAVSSTVAYAVGEGGTFLKTADGSSWSSQDGNSGTWINGVYCTDASTCWAVGNSGTVRYTTNGGSTQWSSGSGASGQLSAVYFASATTGWAVGSSGIIYKSTNNGANWSSQTSGTTENLYDVHCTSTSNCWAVGLNGTILTTTDGGTNWKAQRSGTTGGLSGIDFYDSNTAWISGENLVLQGAYGSSNAYPTNANSQSVSFAATATDDNSDDYYLLFCKTSDAPTAGAPPECNGGSGNRWARSSSPTASDSEATASFTTAPADSQQNTWYAFVCDANNCSSVNQGVGNSGTPFEVNHRPEIGAVTIGPSYGDDSSVDPGNGGTGEVYFRVGVTDADSSGTADTIDMHVCTTDSFTPGSGCGGTTLCSVTGVASSTNAECTDTDLAPIPTAHATNTVYIFIEDLHDFEDGDGTHNQTYSVTDIAPALTSYSTGDSLTISAGGSDTMTYSVSLYDNNGDNDVTDLEMVFFDRWEDPANTSGVNNDCSADDNNCVIENIAGNCTFTGRGDGSDKDLGADCDFTVWFNSTASTYWEAHANPTDGLGQETGFADSNDNNVIASLQGITAVESSIAYGTIQIGRSSDGKTVNVGNVGNQVIDMLVDGDDMCIDSYQATCPGSYIPLAQQKWHHSSSTFNWSDAESGAGPYVMEDDSGEGAQSCTYGATCADTNGCLNRDIQIRDGHSETSTNEAFYWKILIPASQAAGNYYGTNGITATASNSCQGTLY